MPPRRWYCLLIGLAAMSATEQAAVRYAELLTRDIHGVSEAEFQKTRALFNDSQVVELTMATCFFNYFLRYCEGANLPVEKWALDEPVAKIAGAKFEPPPARVALVSDDQMSAVVETLNAAKTPANNWNIGIANSQRAFMLAPGTPPVLHSGASNNGVLRLELPKVERAKPRQIVVKTG